MNKDRQKIILDAIDDLKLELEHYGTEPMVIACDVLSQAVRDYYLDTTEQLANWRPKSPYTH